jgi:hypothetical protein
MMKVTPWLDPRNHVLKSYYSKDENFTLNSIKVTVFRMNLPSDCNAQLCTLKRREDQADELCILSNYLRALDKW